LLKSVKNHTITAPHNFSLYQQGVTCVGILKIEKSHGMIIGESSDTIFPIYLFKSSRYSSFLNSVTFCLTRPCNPKYDCRV